MRLFGSGEIIGAAFRLPEEVGMLHVVDSTKPLERLASDR
jgi:hypothetical protein